MLMKTRELIGEFCGFVEDFYSEMNGAPAMSAGEAWALTKELMGVIFKDLAMARGFVDGIRENSPGFHIWGALKAHEVMQRYRDAQFQDDPALSGVLTHFMLKRRTDIDGNDKLVSKLAALEARERTAGAELALIKKQLNRKMDKA
jgi:hypothetical protein